MPPMREEGVSDENVISWRVWHCWNCEKEDRLPANKDYNNDEYNIDFYKIDIKTRDLVNNFELCGDCFKQLPAYFKDWWFEETMLKHFPRQVDLPADYKCTVGFKVDPD